MTTTEPLPVIEALARRALTRLLTVAVRTLGAATLLLACGDSSSANSNGNSASGSGGSSTGACMIGFAGCACSDEGLCLSGLACVDNVCVAGDTTDGVPTGSASDSVSASGTSTTAGTTQDGTTATTGTTGSTGPSTGEGTSTGTTAAVSVSDSEGTSSTSSGTASASSGGPSSDSDGTTSGASCGDGVAEGGEACDGADLGGVTCQSLGFTYGQLGCTPGCEHDTATCTDSAACGDGVVVQNVLCYQPAVQFGSAQIASVKLGDMNGDGHLDMVGSSQVQGTRVRFGNGDGTFAPEKLFAGVKVHIDHLLDVDKDGDLDLIGAIYSQTKIQIVHNDGAGNLAPAVDYDTFTQMLTTTFADVDGDGWLDMGVCGNYQSKIVAFRRGQPGGLFGPIVSYPIDPTYGGYTCGFIDFDDDGALDLWTVVGAAGGPANAQFRVLYGDGAGNFALDAEAIQFPGSRFAHVVHLDGDDHLDVVGFNLSFNMGELAVRRGTATFLEDMLYTFVIDGKGQREGNPGDFDGNAVFDVLVRSDAWVEVFRGDGTGLFYDGVTLETGPFLYDAAVGDLNEDGLDDVLTVHANQPADDAQKVILSDP
jgi:hypothetical protein